mmetsp:Transcript_116043/g.248119  ORF Transcript_116043/g.248119 Transcript_116043/m.248119 type:complete len:286 (+) Transcript_116043:118-975(+)
MPWRPFGGGASALETDLKKITESGVIEVPKELLDTVVEATRSADDRTEIMKHLRQCLAEPSGNRWRRVYAAMVLAEALIKGAAPALLTETAEGHHFDLVQRLSLLEMFEHSTDKRVQGMVRSKASALRKELVPRLQSGGDGAAAGGSGGSISCEGTSHASSSTGSGRGALSSISSGAGSAESPAVPVWEKPAGHLVLNGVVTVGHNDDTTSESSGGEGPKKAVQYREKDKKGRTDGSRRKKGAAGGRKQRSRGDSTTDSDEAPGRPPVAKAAPAPPPPSVDLLDF